MKELNLKLSDNEYRALQSMVDNGFSICASNCVYEEMQNKNIDCEKCPYTIARHALETMLGLD